ncbi:DUF1800 domain-containing protein [Paenibacillus agricola]|uniref:DUF1800 domain-containing protein n=1 Tax=Paenibacillus agricola TaxID=2716264 RepID=A0ABX0IZ21_9BACL|nr:DUF1800 domain-containing protein [Paenibacillus agricola]NHN29219.1 DUF1800 domain-containing protein [Paenibacillus agricola]
MGVGWTEKEAIHLLNRTGFYTNQADIDACLYYGQAESVRRLVAGESLTGKTAMLQPISQLTADGKEMKFDSIGDQQTYWLYRILNTESPLIEKMTLFWHGHFSTSFSKVNDIPLILRQNELFRNYALGNFHELVLEVGKDPAMMIYLDVNSNRKGKPNENYAREVMELFTLGIGNYTEEDIKETARSLTGWSYDRKEALIKFNKGQYDAASKTILGETGAFNETTVVDVLFKQEALPQFIARKLLKLFATEEPSQEWVNWVAKDVRDEERIGGVLTKLFMSDAFYNPDLYGSLIKTPIEYVAGILKAFNIPLSKNYTQAARKMGMELYLPPDVAGWRGGTTWLMTTNLLSRFQFAESIAKRLNNNLFTSKEYELDVQAKPEDYVRKYSQNAGVWSMGEITNQTLAKYANDTFVYATKKTNGMKGLLQLIMISPEAQMK